MTTLLVSRLIAMALVTIIIAALVFLYWVTPY
jgi:hypothetical protein